MRTARAVRIRGAGGPEVLELVEREVLPPGKGELLVRVEAAGLNRADLLQRRGMYPAPPDVPQDIPGLEYAGVVEEVGAGVLGWSPGDRVMGIVGGGAMAEYLSVPSREATPIPAGLTSSDAAAIPEAYLTAFDALVVQAQMRLGQRVLIHAVGSGVGTAALQLVRAAGAQALGTSRTQDKLDRCASLGLEVGIVTADGKFADAVLEATGGHGGVDCILDLVGGAYLQENLRAVATRGTIVCVGLVGGARGELSLGVLLSKRATVIGTVLRSRPSEEKAALAQRFSQEVLPLFEAGRLQPVVEEVLPFEQVADAHRLLESNRTFGKVVLAWT